MTKTKSSSLIDVKKYVIDDSNISHRDGKNIIRVSMVFDIEMDVTLEHLSHEFGLASDVSRNHITNRIASRLTEMSKMNDGKLLPVIIRKFCSCIIDRRSMECIGEPDDVTVISGRLVENMKEQVDNFRKLCESIGLYQYRTLLLNTTESHMLRCSGHKFIMIGSSLPYLYTKGPLYHEFCHTLITKNTVGLSGHCSIKSSREEKRCDFYAIKRLYEEGDIKEIEVMITYHAMHYLNQKGRNCGVAYDNNDCLYRAALMYRVCRMLFKLKLDIDLDLNKLVKKYIWNRLK